MDTQVRLLSWTAAPLETLRAVWEASKTNDPILDPLLRGGELLTSCLAPPSPYVCSYQPGVDEKFKRAAETEDLVAKIIDMKIPVAEFIDFVFLLEGVSIALREQLVRHRIGVKVDSRIGCDLAPDLAESSWWAQSMRVLDMGKFADNNEYHWPKEAFDSIADPEVRTRMQEKYAGFLLDAQTVYNELAKHMPLEDARMVIPLAAQHRLCWKLNLAALQHIVGKRGCWILQLGLWQPVIEGMVGQLATRIHPLFRDLLRPPCLRGEADFTGCLFAHDNERRIAGTDSLPPCPLFIRHNYRVAGERMKPGGWEPGPLPPACLPPEEKAKFLLTADGWAQWVPTCKDETERVKQLAQSVSMRKRYQRLWGRDVDTGVRLGSQ
jgi:hypothetical protein